MADQVKAFISHPSVENTPIVNIGVDVLKRAQKQSDAGNQDGALGTLLGFAGQFIAPEAATAAYGKIAPAVAPYAEAAGAGLKAGAQGAGRALLEPGTFKGLTDVPGGNVATSAVAGAAAARALGLPGELGGIAGGAIPIARGGIQAARAAWQDVRAAQAAEAAKAARAGLPPRVALWQRAYGTPTVDVEPPPVPPDYAYRDAGTAATIAPDFETAPDARQTLTPEMRARVAEVQAESHAPGGASEPAAPAGAEVTVSQAEPAPFTPPPPESYAGPARPPTKAEALQDAIDQREAYRQMRAEEVEGTNRIQKADDIAGFIVQHDLTVSPENLAKVARGLGYADAPSADSAQMIAERVDALRRAKFTQQTPAAPAPTAAPDLEQQLRDSIAQAQARRAAQAQPAVQLAPEAPPLVPGQMTPAQIAAAPPAAMATAALQNPLAAESAVAGGATPAMPAAVPEAAATPEAITQKVYKGHPFYDWRTRTPIAEKFQSANGPWAGMFSDSEDVANRFAQYHTGPKEDEWPSAVSSATVTMKRPFVIDAKGAPAADFQFDAEHVRKGSSNPIMRAAIENPAYDGILIKNTGDEGDVFIPKDPSQIADVSTQIYKGPPQPFPRPPVFKGETPEQTVSRYAVFLNEKGLAGHVNDIRAAAAAMGDPRPPEGEMLRAISQRRSELQGEAAEPDIAAMTPAEVAQLPPAKAARARTPGAKAAQPEAETELIAPVIPDAPRPLAKVYGPNWAQRPDAAEIKAKFNAANNARARGLKAYKRYVEESNRRFYARQANQ